MSEVVVYKDKLIRICPTDRKQLESRMREGWDIAWRMYAPRLLNQDEFVDLFVDRGRLCALLNTGRMIASCGRFSLGWEQLPQ